MKSAFTYWAARDDSSMNLNFVNFLQITQKLCFATLINLPSLLSFFHLDLGRGLGPSHQAR